MAKHVPEETCHLRQDPNLTTDPVELIERLLGLPRYVYSIPLKNKFRSITRREGILFAGPQGWAEWSPFTEYSITQAARWLNCTLEAAFKPLPEPRRERIPVNVTVPVVNPQIAAQLVQESGCRSAKVKIADPMGSKKSFQEVLQEDYLRLCAVREALGPDGKIRVDANGAYSVDEAIQVGEKLADLGLEYIEQPCRTTEELAEVKNCFADRGLKIKIAADESIRQLHDVEKVVQLAAADVVVLKVQPLGGIQECLTISEKTGLDSVVSSALETSVGLSYGLQLASTLPALNYACGLNTARLFIQDITYQPLVDSDGMLQLKKITPSKTLLAKYCAPQERISWWEHRLIAVASELAQQYWS